MEVLDVSLFIIQWFIGYIVIFSGAEEYFFERGVAFLILKLLPGFIDAAEEDALSAMQDEQMRTEVFNQ